MNGRFQILLRRRQNEAQIPAGTGPVVKAVIQCNPLTGYAEWVAGTVDNTTPFDNIIPVNGWYDFTDFIENAEKISFTWDKINSGNSGNSATNPDGSNYDKGLTAELLFFDSAYKFIYDWLLNSECDILNCVEVKIIDLISRASYRLFEIKSDNIEYAPVDEPCQLQIKLREQDNKWTCIHKTFIFDNWQHWFEDSGVKTHPCFLTCIEPRPRLVQSVRMGFMVFGHSAPLFSSSGSIDNKARAIMNADRFVDAPLVRTYIENVAGKCGLHMDTIFNLGKEYENLCLFYPQAGYMHESDSDGIASPSLAYNYDNRWLITIAELLDKLKVLFAAEWYVTPDNTIQFKYIKDLIDLQPIYDFTAPDAVPIFNLKYSFNGTKKPAYGRYKYQEDGSDLASQEMSTLYSDIIDYDGPAVNPMLEGEKTKNFEFAPTGFVRDGRAKDYLHLLIEDGKTVGIILCIILSLVAVALIATGHPVVGGIIEGYALLWIAKITTNTNNLKDQFVWGPTYSGAVRLTSEQVMTPRLIMWDGLSEQRAKVEALPTLPAPNPYYNPDLVPYDVKNRIAEDNASKIIYNYPLYFDGDFQGNLFDKAHDVVDNPLKSKESHQDVKFSTDLCEDMLHLFGVFENEYAAIGKIVKVEHRDNYDVFMRVGNINVDYDSNTINLRGVVLRRPSVLTPTDECSTFQINSRCLIINGNHININ